MEDLLSIKVDPRMKIALKKLADKQFNSISGIVKQAVERLLEEQGVDWRKEGIEIESDK
jgi:predicted transcriptional regulator